MELYSIFRTENESITTFSLPKAKVAGQKFLLPPDLQLTISTLVFPLQFNVRQF